MSELILIDTQKEKHRFYAGGDSWTDEYPDAQIYTTLGGAIEAADYHSKQKESTIDVVINYGLENEGVEYRAIWKAEEPDEMHEEVHHQVFEAARKAMYGKAKEFLAAGYPAHLVDEGLGLALASLQQVFDDFGTACPDGVIGLAFGEPGDLWLELRDH